MTRRAHNPDQLVECPPGDERSVLGLFVIGLFASLLCGTCVIDRMFPLERASLTGHERVRDQLRRRNATWSDGTLAQLVEYDLRQTSRVRSALGQPYALALYLYLDEAIAAILVGKDGWLFHRYRTKPPGNTTSLTLTRGGAAAIAALTRRLYSLGVDVTVAPIPRKSVLYSEYLPPKIDARAEIERGFEYELVRRGVVHGDLFAKLGAAEGEDPLYFKLDSHWTETAQLLAAEAVCRASGLLRPQEERLTQVRRSRSRVQRRDQLEYIGVHFGREVPAYLKSKQVVGYDVFLDDEIVEHTNPERMSRIAVVGTSFTARRKFPKFLAHFAGEPVFNLAQPGSSFVAILKERFREFGVQGLPALLIIELPVHTLFDLDVVPELPSLCSTLPAGAALPLLPQASLAVAAWAGRRQVPSERQQLLALRGMQLMHSGDGVVDFVFEGSVSGGPLRLTFLTGGAQYSLLWEAGVERLVVPILTPLAGSKGVRVLANSVLKGQLARLELTSVRVTAAHDGSGGRALTAGPVSMQAEGWILPFETAGLGVVPPFGSLVIELEGHAEGDVSVLVRSADGALAIEPRAARLQSEGVIVVSLAALAGAELGRIELQGAGSQAPLARAKLITLARTERSDDSW